MAGPNRPLKTTAITHDSSDFLFGRRLFSLHTILPLLGTSNWFRSLAQDFWYEFYTHFHLISYHIIPQEEILTRISSTNLQQKWYQSENLTKTDFEAPNWIHSESELNESS